MGSPRDLLDLGGVGYQYFQYEIRNRAVLAAMVAPCVAVADNWPQFRGPGGQGHSSETQLPTQWSSSENMAWRTEIAGKGWSSPVVWGNRVVVTTTTDEDRSCRVICLDAETGEIIWNTEAFRQVPQHKERRNSYATPTPVVNDEGVYAVFGNGSMVRLDWAGAVQWVNDDVDFYSRHGLGASPIIVDELLIMPYDGSKRVDAAGGWPNIPPDEKIGWQVPWNEARVMAVNLSDGKVNWKVGRGMSRIAHVSPNVAIVDGKPQLLSAAGDVIQGFDPSDGRMIWTAYSQGEGVTPSFAFGDGLMFTASGFEKSTVRTVRLGGEGDVTESHIAWENRKGVPSESSLVYVSPYLYAVTNGGIVTCYQGQSGEIVWQERIGGKHCASPVHANGLLYFLAMDGTTTLVRAGNQFEIVAVNKLEGNFQASLALSNGRVLIRSEEALHCISLN